VGLVEAKSSGIEHVGDLAEYLVGERGGRNEIAAAASGDLGRGEQGGECVARVAATHGRDITVIEIQITDHDAIGEDREFVTCLNAAAENRRSRRRAHSGGQVNGDPAWSGLVAANRAADRIENGAFCRTHNVPRQILIAEPGGEVRQRLRDRAAAVKGSISHSLSFGILLCHDRQSRRCSDRGARCHQLLQELTARISRRIG
jgi:hypothetical protein